MRLLLLSLSAPVPANNGQKMRTWSIMRALASEGHGVTLLTFVNPAEPFDVPAAREVCTKVISVPLHLQSLVSSADYFDRLRSMFSGKPHAIRRFACSEMRHRVESELESKSYDAVICETAFGIVNVPRGMRVPLVLDNQNVEHLILERYARLEANLAKRLYAKLEARKMKNMERDACLQASVSLCCSGTDQKVFSRICPQSDIRVIPNCIDVDQYQPAHQSQPFTVLYQGGMDWFPNRDAVEFFAHAILPALRKAHPALKFVVAGRNPSAEFRDRLASIPGVLLTGTVPDMAPLIADATVCVVPLRIGSGTRLKILEAAAMARPIVSTRIGAEGLEFRNGKEIILADTPEEFTAAVSNLLMDPALRARLGNAARLRVEQSYSFSALRQSLRAVLHDGKPSQATAGCS